MARKFTDFVNKHPNVKFKGSQKKMEVVSNRQIEEKIKKLKLLWKDSAEIKSRHWSGLKIEERAQKAGIDYERFYNDSFILLSWHIQ